MNHQTWAIRARRVLGAGFAVIALSVLLLCVPILIYAFVLALRVRGTPDQAAINQFAATISRAVMPWLERLLTLLLAFRVVRRAEAARATDGLLLGAVAGVLGLGVTLAFGGGIAAPSIVSLLVIVGLGWVGGFAGQKMTMSE